MFDWKELKEFPGYYINTVDYNILHESDERIQKYIHRMRVLLGLDDVENIKIHKN